MRSVVHGLLRLGAEIRVTGGIGNLRVVAELPDGSYIFNGDHAYACAILAVVNGGFWNEAPPLLFERRSMPDGDHLRPIDEP